MLFNEIGLFYTLLLAAFLLGVLTISMNWWRAMQRRKGHSKAPVAQPEEFEYKKWADQQRERLSATSVLKATSTHPHNPTAWPVKTLEQQKPFYPNDEELPELIAKWREGAHKMKEYKISTPTVSPLVLDAVTGVPVEFIGCPNTPETWAAIRARLEEAETYSKSKEYKQSTPSIKPILKDATIYVPYKAPEESLYIPPSPWVGEAPGPGTTEHQPAQDQPGNHYENVDYGGSGAFSGSGAGSSYDDSSSSSSDSSSYDSGSSDSSSSTD